MSENNDPKGYLEKQNEAQKWADGVFKGKKFAQNANTFAETKKTTIDEIIKYNNTFGDKKTIMEFSPQSLHILTSGANETYGAIKTRFTRRVKITKSEIEAHRSDCGPESLITKYCIKDGDDFTHQALKYYNEIAKRTLRKAIGTAPATSLPATSLGDKVVANHGSLSAMMGGCPAEEIIFDDINSPAHYRDTKIRDVDVIDDWGLCWRLGNVLKYLKRYKTKHKDPIVDLKKARKYLDMKIEELEKLG